MFVIHEHSSVVFLIFILLNIIIVLVDVLIFTQLDKKVLKFTLNIYVLSVWLTGTDE